MNMAKQNISGIFLNLTVHDLARTRAFWEKLGFGFDEEFTDGSVLCLILKEKEIYAMLHLPESMARFTTRPIADGTTTQVLISVEVESRARVDEIVQIALENGATRYLPSEDNGWMYYDRFADPDGHQWEIAFMDLSLLPTP